MGSGGRNQTHNRTTKYSRLDSQQVADILRGMEYSGYDKRAYRNVVIYRDRIEIDGIPVNYSWQRVGYGSRDRLFLVCPVPSCGCRFRYLYCIPYQGKEYPICRHCANLNYPIQQVTHGWYEAVHKMRRILRNAFKITENLAPIDMEALTPPRPKGMRYETYIKHLAELRRAQDEYYKAFLLTAKKLIGWI